MKKDAQESTCWTLIDAAAHGDEAGRDEFARRYERPVRAYLSARWRGTKMIQLLEDAVQDVFFECFREGGVIDRVDPACSGGFRAFLYGAVRNVARYLERRQTTRQKHFPGKDRDLGQVSSDETSLSQVFDRAWAKELMKQAAERQRELAEQAGESALRRVELLRLRFSDDKPIRDIAEQWQMDPVQVHREYAKARKEFHLALKEVIAFHHAGPPEDIEEQCRQILTFLR